MDYLPPPFCKTKVGFITVCYCQLQKGPLQTESSGPAVCKQEIWQIFPTCPPAPLPVSHVKLHNTFILYVSLLAGHIL